MIRIEQLTKHYGDTTVLNISEMDIPKGQVFGLVGNNGAGKTNTVQSTTRLDPSYGRHSDD